MLNPLGILPLTRVMEIPQVNASPFSGMYSAKMGAQKAAEKVADEAEALANGDLNIDHFIELKEQTTLYSLNLKLLKITDEMIGQVLNLFA